MVKYICKRCKKVFKQKIDYTRHCNRKRKCKKMPRISPKSAPEKSCPNCGQSFARKYHLIRHLSGRCPVLKASCNRGKNSGQKFQNVKICSELSEEREIYMTDEDSEFLIDSENESFDSENESFDSKNESSWGKLTCKYCKKSISRKNNLKRHLKTCKEKVKTELEERLQEEIKKNKKLKNMLKEKEDVETEYFKFMKQVALKSSTNITYNDNKQKNMYFIMNNYKSAYNFKELMDPEISAAETRSIKRKGPTNGSYYLLSKRCITDIDVENRPFHCVDNSRNKYLLYTENDWKIDPNADKIIQTAVDKVSSLYETEITRQDTVKSRDRKLVNISKLIDLEKVGRKKILKELNKDTSIKTCIKE